MPPSDANYYAVDAPKVQMLVDQVVTEISKASDLANSDVTACAVLDEAFDYGSTRLPLSLPAERLYCLGRWERLAELSPVLIQLPVGQGKELHQAIGRLVRHSAVRPMLSFAVSRLGLADLASHWRDCIAPAVAGMEAPLLRFADTRVAAVLPASLEPANWRRLSAPVDHWWIVDRAGRLAELRLPMAEPASVPTQTHAFELSDDEVNRLVQASMPDTLVQTMIDQLPELVPKDGRLQFYELMSEVVDQAEKNEIDAYPDIYALAVYAVMSGDISLTNQALVEVFRAKDWKIGELSTRLVELL